MRLDLHLHTWLSDGGIAPKQLQSAVRSRKLKAWSITDHDTMAAYDHVELDEELIPGVEVTCEDAGSEVHVVALGVDRHHPGFQTFLADIRSLRERRIQIILDHVNADFNLSVTLDQVRTNYCEVLTRAHVAECLLRVGPWRYRGQLFAEVIGDKHLQGWGLDPYPSVEAAVPQIHAAGGVAILAHPARYPDHETIAHLMAKGLDGLELKHPRVPAECEQFMRDLVEEHGYLMSCGSDLHFMGRRQPGDCRLSHSEAAPLLQRLGWSDPLGG